MAMQVQVIRALDDSAGTVAAAVFDALDEEEQIRELLGKRTGDPIVETRVDKHVKKVLVKAWKTARGRL